MMLEKTQHGDNSFVTLTYDNEHLPKEGNLDPGDTQLWLKRLRKSLAPGKIRYFLVGEYGDKNRRPHYHVALFGVGEIGLRLQVEKILSSGAGMGTIATWDKGKVCVGDVTSDSCGYMAGYVTKKLTKKGDEKLCGRHPEFARMSRGLGSGFMGSVAAVLRGSHGASFLVEGDVPNVLQHGGKKLPLGRFLRKKLREKMEMGSDPPEGSDKEWIEEMRGVLALAQSDPKNKNKTLGQIVTSLDVQEILNVEGRHEIKNARSL